MKPPIKLTLGLSALLFATTLAAAPPSGVAHEPGMDCDHTGMMSDDMTMDSVARAHKHLSELEAKLKLTQDQQPAWKTFSDQVSDQAESMKAMHDKMKDKTEAMPKTAPEHMAKMADMMKDRAENMAKMADAVKTFYATLT